ncbi:MAG TPA: hypothetical protein VIL97_06155, partial [Thermoanaerobaculia bacterium]
MFSKVRFVPLVCCLLLVTGASAQTITYDDQLSLPAPTISGETGLFTTITGETLRQGDWSFSIYYNNYDYLAAPAPELRPPSRRSYRDMDLEEDRISASIGVGLTDRWELVASIPYIMLENNAGDLAGYVNGFPYVGKFDENGVGNLHIGTKVGLLDPDAYASRVALSAFVDLPTGDDEGGIATGNTDWGLGLHWNYRLVSAAAQYKIVGDRDDDVAGLTIELPDEIRLDAGLNIPLSFWSTTNWIS